MDVFDIIGPVMIGPSSSHTAGAVRIGQVARQLLNETPKKVSFKLHGSFAKTGKGHGTDKALLGGVLGFEMYNEEITDSFHIAKQNGLEYSFEETDLGLVHPNTTLVDLEGVSGNRISVQASSIGGGRIEVTRINGAVVSFSAELDTLIVFQKDKAGVVAAISNELSNHSINIAYMKLHRESKGEQAVTVIETDQVVNETCVKSISGLNHINHVMYISPISREVFQ